MSNIKLVENTDAPRDEIYDFVVNGETVGLVVIDVMGNYNVDEEVYDELDKLIKAGVVEKADDEDEIDVLSRILNE